MMRRIYLAQVNYQYGNNTFLPYSVGRLWAYAKQDAVIAAEYELAELLFVREPIDQVLERMERPDVFGGSCYIWNWTYTTELARRIKERWPECLVVLGGPQVPNQARGFRFYYHPYVNAIVRGEGEEPFAQILRERARGYVHWHAVMGPHRSKILDDLPSPYLEGVFDELIKLPYDFHASQETNRGCPFECSFCMWGSATMAKVRAFDADIVAEEINWFSRHQVELIYNCDANWGILKQDEQHTDRLIEAKRETGYPKQFRAAYAKKTTPRVFKIAKALSDADMCKGVTLSVQSMNAKTLEQVKRLNIPLPELAKLVREYREQGVPTYTEVILGLPGETYETFADGLATLLEIGQHESISIYPCIKLDNSEMAEPAYIEKHGIETARMPMLLLHGSPGHDECQETYELVVATRDMPHEDWRRAYVFGWAVQAFHCLGLTRVVAIMMRKHGIGYRDFYERLISWCRITGTTTALGRELVWLDSVLDKALSGHPWDTIVQNAGPITWPPEEATFLRMMRRRVSFYFEIAKFLAAQRWTSDAAWLNNGLMVDPEQYASFEYYARDVVWYGRKTGRFMDPAWTEVL